MKDDIPKSIILKNQYKLYKTIKPKHIKNTSEELYNYILLTDKLLHSRIEIEVKLGKVLFEGNYKLFEYINDPILLPPLQNQSQNKITFQSDIPKYFNLIQYYINKEIEVGIGIGIKDIQPIQPRLYKELYFGDTRHIFIYENGKIISEEVNQKVNKKHLNIKYNQDMDYRITACVESPKSINKNEVIKSYREKLRTSYKFQFFQIDFTIVKSIFNFSKRNIDFKYEEVSSKVNDLDADSIGTPMISYELEVEFVELYQFLIQTNYDYNQFENIIGRLIENTNMFINSCSFENYMALTRTEEHSLYGNYIKNYVLK